VADIGGQLAVLHLWPFSEKAFFSNTVKSLYGTRYST
jgi:hypothetical protein